MTNERARLPYGETLKQEPKDILTSHERRILLLLAEGRQYEEIAHQINRATSPHTITNIICAQKETCGKSGIYEKLGASSGTAAVVEAIRQEIINLDEINVEKVIRNGGPKRVIPLTEAQIEILKLVARGKTNRQIAIALGISKSTIKNQLSYRGKWGSNSGIFERLQVPPSRIAAVVKALQLGIFSLEDTEEVN